MSVCYILIVDFTHLLCLTVCGPCRLPIQFDSRLQVHCCAPRLPIPADLARTALNTVSCALGGDALLFDSCMHVVPLCCAFPNLYNYISTFKNFESVCQSYVQQRLVTQHESRAHPTHAPAIHQFIPCKTPPAHTTLPADLTNPDSRCATLTHVSPTAPASRFLLNASLPVQYPAISSPGSSQAALPVCPQARHPQLSTQPLLQLTPHTLYELLLPVQLLSTPLSSGGALHGDLSSAIYMPPIQATTAEYLVLLSTQPLLPAICLPTLPVVAAHAAAECPAPASRPPSHAAN